MDKYHVMPIGLSVPFLSNMAESVHTESSKIRASHELIS